MNKQVQDKLKTYEALLIKWQKAINLVSPGSLKECGTRHFLDSQQINDFIPEGTKTLYDLGSGAGFPGLVLAMMRPEIEVHLIESDQRKCAFLSTVSRETETPVGVHTIRIESLDMPAPDVVSARALASLNKLFEWCAHWAEENPALLFLLPKGERAEEEIAEAQKHFDFRIERMPSKTDSHAKILKISSLKARVSV